MAKSKFYVVWKGRSPGIYPAWAECEAQVKGFPDAKYKSFTSLAQAEQAFEIGWRAYYGQAKPPPLPPEVIADSISVDAACDGSPGNMEYRGVETASGKELYHVGPLCGTNNLGEFLAIVDALKLLQKQGKNSPVYSDSRNALLWVERKYIGSKLPRNAKSEAVWSRADAALAWLKINDFSNPLLKWNTEAWGENRADFGRK